MINLNNNGHHFILASKSPRRQFLLAETGLKFEVKTIETDETYPAHLKCEEIAVYISRNKALAFDMEKLPAGTVLISADTVVWLGDESLAKPGDEAEAAAMLQKLSGKGHTVVTGMCLRSRERLHCFYEKTEVFFRELEPAEIEYYIKNYKPFDKAGAYGIQEWIGYVGVERIEGCYYNVMGLPVQKLFTELREFTGN